MSNMIGLPVGQYPIVRFLTAIALGAAALAGSHATWADEQLPPGEAQQPGFYGLPPVGERIIYLLDNSNSMIKRSRFDAASIELLRSVGDLKQNQSFYVILFSDQAYPVFHPRPARDFLKPTEDNRRRVRRWLESMKRSHFTNAAPAVARALAMQPNTIYLLTDGAFTDNTTARLLDARVNGPVIHTIGLEVPQEKTKLGRLPEADLKAIARKFGGRYRYVHLGE